MKRFARPLGAILALGMTMTSLGIIGVADAETGSTAAPAVEPAPYVFDAAVAERLGTQVFSAPDPEAAFSALNVGEQASVIDWVTPVTASTEAETDAVTVPSPVELVVGATQLRLNAGCWIGTHPIIYRNIFNTELFRYTARTTWCHNGTLVTDAGWQCIPSVSTLAWKFSRHILNTGTGNNTPLWNTVCQGQFDLQVLTLYIAQRLPFINTRVTGAGLVTSNAIP